MEPLGSFLEKRKDVCVFYSHANSEAQKLLSSSHIHQEKIIDSDSREFKNWKHKLLSSLKYIPIVKKVIKLHLETDIALEIFKEFEIDIVALYGDFNLGKELYFIRAAKLQKIKSVLLPISVSNPSFMAKCRLSQKPQCRVNGLKKVFFQKFFNKQIYRYKNESVLFYPPLTTIILSFLNILPENVWYMGGGNSDYVFVQNLDYKNFLMSNGVLENKLVVTGQFSMDSLYQSLRDKNESQKNDLYEKYQLDSSKGLLVFAMPQFYEHKLMTKSEHETEINHILKTLSELDVNVLCSLHPKMSFETYVKLENKFNVKMLQERMSEVLSFADFYVGCFESTTRWAHDLKIPSLFLNYFDLGFDLTYMKGLIILNEKSRLKKKLNELLLSKKSERLEEEENFIDGKCGDRIYQSFSKIVEEARC